MSRHLVALPVLLLVATLAGAQPRAKLPPPATRKVDFTRDIRPILERACVSCHGAAKHRGGLRLDDGTHALKGGSSGAAIRPGNSVNSRLIRAVAGLDADMKMPPRGRKELSASEIGLLRAWIDQGAVWPRGAGGAAGEAGKSAHWAFQPIRRPALPTVSDEKWLRNPIDAFILARLEKEKVAPSPEADRVTLLRRLSLDLVGLPPGPAEVEAFVNDTAPDAYDRVVDHLLASPHYGERWGRHWLDLAHYADSDGFEKDGGRPFAWRYRHYVIAALNRDLHYDRFALEQLAGDLLPGIGIEQKVATGFHRNTLTNNEGGIDKEQYRVEAVVDRTNTTARIFLGLTLGCAQCHDHKYDPLSQKEYYQFFAFFNSNAEVNIPAPVVSFRQADDDNILSPKKREILLGLLEQQRIYLAANLPKQLAILEALPPVQRRQLPANVRAILAIPAETRTADQKKQLENYLDRGLARFNADYRKIVEGIVILRKATHNVGVHAMALRLGLPRHTYVMIRGDFQRHGAQVVPGTPAVLPPLEARMPNRYSLAHWLVDGNNPLTPRVAVNWVWSKYFGQGLVGTLDDFGTQGERPSHPELLDYLAGEFMRRKWSLKELHRLIVTSATYRQSSKARPELLTQDPYNRLIARQQRLRLEAEAIRDVMLESSGLLVKTLGGPSVRPPQPAGVSELSYAFTGRWIESKGADRYRRGLYTWFQRTSPYPMLTTFDAPDSSVCCVKRERSNTPLQALTLLNDAVFVECAQALGQRVLAECKGGLVDQLRYAFRLCTARTPTQAELARLKQLHGELFELCVTDLAGSRELIGTMKLPPGVNAAEAATWMALGRTLLNLDEVVTRE